MFVKQDGFTLPTLEQLETVPFLSLGDNKTEKAFHVTSHKSTKLKYLCPEGICIVEVLPLIPFIS